jgi:hypothetical protein
MQLSIPLKRVINQLDSVFNKNELGPIFLFVTSWIWTHDLMLLRGTGCHFELISFAVPRKLDRPQGDQMRFWKSRPKCSPINFFSENDYMGIYRGKSSLIIWATSIIFTKTTQRKHTICRRKFAQSGHRDRPPTFNMYFLSQSAMQVKKKQRALDK